LSLRLTCPPSFGPFFQIADGFFPALFFFLLFLALFSPTQERYVAAQLVNAYLTSPEISPFPLLYFICTSREFSPSPPYPDSRGSWILWRFPDEDLYFMSREFFPFFDYRPVLIVDSKSRRVDERSKTRCFFVGSPPRLPADPFFVAFIFLRHRADASTLQRFFFFSCFSFPYCLTSSHRRPFPPFVSMAIALYFALISVEETSS